MYASVHVGACVAKIAVVGMACYSDIAAASILLALALNSLLAFLA